MVVADTCGPGARFRYPSLEETTRGAGWIPSGIGSGRPAHFTGWSFVYPRPWDREGTPELAGACSLAPGSSPPLQLRTWSSGAPLPRRVEKR